MKIILVPLLACNLYGFSVSSGAAGTQAVVALCRSPIASARHLVLLPQPDGPPLNLVVATVGELPAGADCRVVSTEFPLEAVTWLGAVQSNELDADSRIGLTFSEADQKILALEVEPREPSQPSRQLVPRTEVLPVANFRVFGGEERVSAKPDVTAFEIVCWPGQQQAGAVLDLGDAPPAGAFALELQVEATEGFFGQVIGAHQEARDRGVEIPSGHDAARSLMLPIVAGGSKALVITCPGAEGRLRLTRGIVRSAATRSLDRPSAWAWEPEMWKSHTAELLAAASRLGLGRLYVSIPSTNAKVVDPSALASFVAAAHAFSIDVMAVEGDPDMISGEGRANAVARAHALARYNASAAPQEQLDGVQYDIEPYLGSGYAARSDVVWQLWAETLHELSTALGQRVDAVVPYWMLESAAAWTALDQVVPILDRLTIMAYRTDPSAIISAAAPLLAWSSSKGLAAIVALEVGTVAQERRKVYVKAPKGDLHVIRFDDVAAIVVLDRVRTGPTDRAYRLSHSVSSNPARVSFDGDTRAAIAAAAQTASDLAAWPSAHGFAFHGLTPLTANAVAGSWRAR